MGDIIIIGSGVAGHSAAAEISRLAPSRQVDVVGAEVGIPYDRPPLSKDYLVADRASRPTLGSSQIYGDQVRLRDGITVEGVQRATHSLSLSDGTSLQYEMLLLATGSRLRRLPLAGVGPERIHYLRTIDDAHRLRAALLPEARVCIIGGGFIGLEVAAAAKRRGCSVTLLELAPNLLSRGATFTLGRYAMALHRGHGINIVLGAGVRTASDAGDGVLLSWAGGEVRADVVVVGVGVVPNVELAVDAGLAVDDGIVVDQACRTSDAAIFAAGEATSYPIGELGIRMRTESWSAASTQAVVAARRILGLDAIFRELPWFWSDQYDVNIQCVGLPKAAHEYLQIGDPTSTKWLRIGIDDAGKLVGAEGVNMGREVSALRRADRAGQPIPGSLLDLADAREPAASTDPDAKSTLVTST